MIDLITGHQGTPHISALQVATLNKSMMQGSADDVVIRMKDGELVQNGLSVQIGTGFWRANGYDIEITEQEVVYLDPTGAGMYRIDDIYVEILQNLSSGIQRAELIVVQGEEDAVSPVDPSAPVAPESTTDSLVQVVQIAKCELHNSAMTLTDMTTLYETFGGALFIDSNNYISIDYSKVKREE